MDHLRPDHEAGDRSATMLATLAQRRAPHFRSSEQTTIEPRAETCGVIAPASTTVTTTPMYPGAQPHRPTGLPHNGGHNRPAKAAGRSVLASTACQRSGSCPGYVRGRTGGDIRSDNASVSPSRSNEHCGPALPNDPRD